jgi:hypothetical protein
VSGGAGRRRRRAVPARLGSTRLCSAPLGPARSAIASPPRPAALPRTSRGIRRGACRVRDAGKVGANRASFLSRKDPGARPAKEDNGLCSFHAVHFFFLQADILVWTLGMALCFI